MLEKKSTNNVLFPALKHTIGTKISYGHTHPIQESLFNNLLNNIKFI